MKIIKNYEELPREVKEKVEENLEKDILERYNSEEYQNPDIIHNTLSEYNYKLADNN